MNSPPPILDEYQVYMDPTLDAAECMRYAADLLTWLRLPTHPIWIESPSPSLVEAFHKTAINAEVALRSSRSNLLATKNAASCQNAAPRLSETTEPQAL